MMPKSFAFGLSAFKKYPELIPLAFFIGSAVGGCCLYMGYAVATKPDVRLLRGGDLPPWEKIKATQSTKLFTINQKYIENPELEQLRKEIGSYKY